MFLRAGQVPNSRELPPSMGRFANSWTRKTTSAMSEILVRKFPTDCELTGQEKIWTSLYFPISYYNSMINGLII